MNLPDGSRMYGLFLRGLPVVTLNAGRRASVLSSALSALQRDSAAMRHISDRDSPGYFRSLGIYRDCTTHFFVDN